MGGNETKVNFVLVTKTIASIQKCENNPLEVATSAGGKTHEQKKAVKNEHTVIRRAWKLNKKQQENKT